MFFVRFRWGWNSLYTLNFYVSEVYAEAVYGLHLLHV